MRYLLVLQRPKRNAEDLKLVAKEGAGERGRTTHGKAAFQRKNGRLWGTGYVNLKCKVTPRPGAEGVSKSTAGLDAAQLMGGKGIQAVGGRTERKLTNPSLNEGPYNHSVAEGTRRERVRERASTLDRKAMTPKWSVHRKDGLEAALLALYKPMKDTRGKKKGDTRRARSAEKGYRKGILSWRKYKSKRATRRKKYRMPPLLSTGRQKRREGGSLHEQNRLARQKKTLTG